MREGYRQLKKLTPEQRQQLRERWQNATPEQRQRWLERRRQRPQPSGPNYCVPGPLGGFGICFVLLPGLAQLMT